MTHVAKIIIHHKNKFLLQLRGNNPNIAFPLHWNLLGGVVEQSEKLEDIETTGVENFNGIIRERVGRFVRRTKCYGKKTERVSNALSVFQFYWHFIKPIKEKLTPSILENQATKIWTWGNFFNAKLKYL